METTSGLCHLHQENGRLPRIKSARLLLSAAGTGGTGWMSLE
jgi:hypothetical protein